MSTRRTDLAEWIAHADPAGLLYGGIVTASVLATVSAHSESKEYVALATFGVLVLYWFAHVYVKTQTMQYDGDRRAIHRRIGEAARHEASVLKGGIPALTVYVVCAFLFGLQRGAAAFVALDFSVVFLVVVGYLGAHRAGLPGRQALVEAAGAGLLGALAVFAKVLLH
jgi:hypothetical protein